MNAQKRIFTVLNLLVLACVLRGQSPEWRPGSYISFAGDTLTGWICSDISLERSQWLRFRADSLGDARIVPFSTLAAFEFDATRRYEILRGDGDSWRLLEQLVDGPVALFQTFQPWVGPIYYFREGGEYTRVDRGNYPDFLNAAFSACPAVRARLPAPYRYGTLLDLAFILSACKDSHVTPQLVAPPRRLFLLLGARLNGNFGALRLRDNNYYALGDYQGFHNLGFGFSAQLRPSQRVAFSLDLAYLRQRAQAGFVNTPPFEDETSYSEVDYRMTYLEAPLTIQYRWPQRRFTPFAEAGLYAGIPVARSVLENAFSSDPAFEPPRNAFDGWNWGFIGGLGLAAPFNANVEGQLLLRFASARTQQETLSGFFQSTRLFSTLDSNKWEIAFRLLWYRPLKLQNL
jgi:hypothetical protein